MCLHRSWPVGMQAMPQGETETDRLRETERKRERAREREGEREV